MTIHLLSCYQYVDIYQSHTIKAAIYGTSIQLGHYIVIYKLKETRQVEHGQFMAMRSIMIKIKMRTFITSKFYCLLNLLTILHLSLTDFIKHWYNVCVRSKYQRTAWAIYQKAYLIMSLECCRHSQNVSGISYGRCLGWDPITKIYTGRKTGHTKKSLKEQFRYRNTADYFLRIFVVRDVPGCFFFSPNT